MRLTLVITAPARYAGTKIPVRSTEFVIGRAPGSQLRLKSHAVSETHCALRVQGARVSLRDFNSATGTFLNDRHVRGSQEVHGGDRIKVGPAELTVCVESGPPGDEPTLFEERDEPSTVDFELMPAPEGP